MPQQKIPFTNQQTSGQEEIAGASPVAVNVCIDKLGTTIRRPGISASIAAQQPYAVIGLHVSLADRIFAIYETPAERKIYDVTSTPFLLATSGGSPQGVAGTARPQFAETEMIIAVAGGADMQKIVLTPTEFTERLGGSPPAATHVVANASRLEANDLNPDSSRTIIRFSGIAQGTITYAGLEQWTIGIGNAGFITAEANPDPILALAANSNEILAFGSRTIQVFGSDPSFVFGTVAAREVGMGAAYSLIAYDQQFFWLDNRRRIVVSDGRDYQVISDPIKRTLDAMSRVDDCFGFRVVMGPVDAVVWVFPTDGRTFAFQLGGGWSEWLGWGANWQQWPVTSLAYRAADGTHLVGLSSGAIGTLDLDTETDLGAPIRAYVETGFINRGTDSQKECLCVEFALRRGEGSATPGPLGFFWWQDFPGQVMDKVPLDFGSSGDFDIVLPFYGLGVYRRRKWFFEFAGSGQMVLVSATETFNVLEDY